MKIRELTGERKNILNIFLLIFVSALMLSGIFLVRRKLLENAQRLGTALVHSYAVEEEVSLDYMQSNLQLAAKFVDEIIDGGGSAEDIQRWLESYFSKTLDTMGKGAVDFYAVINGKIIAANPWAGDEGYDYAETEWYLSAVEAAGQPVVGDVYHNAVTGQKVITISQALNMDGSVIAMDIYIGSRSLHNTVQSMPENCSYFLCDGQGMLICSSLSTDTEDNIVQKYADYIMAGIKDGSLLAYDATVTDLSGINRGVYYQTMSNGWTVIMTIPMHSILMGEENLIIYFMAAISIILFITLFLMTLRDMLSSRSLKKADDTIHILGDSFYAIYRVNFREGSYEAIKRHPDIMSVLPEKGEYSLFLATMDSLVTHSTFKAFESSFSLESIRRRIDMGILDYGGDYQRRFGNDYRWVNVRSLYNRDLTPDEVVLCFRDVDEEKLRELQNLIILRNALDTAQKSTKAKSEFFSNMSHDMRTPLNAIIGCCTLAQQCYGSGDESKVWDYIRKIQFSSNQLLNLINDILELSRMEAGRHSLDERELDLEKLLSSTAELFQVRAKMEEKVLELNIDLQDPLVLGDEKKITQIVNNLLSNAVKYTNAGDSIRLEARQFVFQQYSRYQIVVEDTGIGMSQEFLDHLFDPYSRETAFSSHPTVGTGLGMSIVKGLVQQMSGEISVESALGKGSRFTVTLPLTAAERRLPPAEEDPGQDRPGFCWEGRSILVAEDNELNREIITEVLQQLGAKVLTAANGQEAVHLFSAQAHGAIDAILMDMQMPVMDGCQAASAIRQLDRADARCVPIVAVTANVFAEDIARTTQAGMNGHVSKPIDIKVLTQTLGKLILQSGQSRDGKEQDT